MTKKSTTFGLSPEIMTELLRMGSDEHNYEKDVSIEQKKAELLLDRLAEPLLLDPSLVKLLPIIPSLLSDAMDLCGGEPIGDLLQNPENEISVLRKVKNYNNKLSKRGESEIERDTAIALYYGAIASSLLFHNKKISNFSYKNLEHSFSSLIDKSWMTSELAAFFTKAREICRNPPKKPHRSDKQHKCELNDSRK